MPPEPFLSLEPTLVSLPDVACHMTSCSLTERIDSSSGIASGSW